MKTGFFIIIIIGSLLMSDKQKAKVVKYTKSKYSSIVSSVKKSTPTKTYKKKKITRSISSTKKRRRSRSKYKRVNKMYTSEQFGYKKGATCFLQSVRKFKKRGKWFVNTKMTCQGRTKLQHKVRKRIIASL